MLIDDFKQLIKKHIVDDFETSVVDSEDVSDGIVDSVYAGLSVFQSDLDVMSQEDQDLFYEYVEEVIGDLVERFEEQLEEDEDEEE